MAVRSLWTATAPTLQAAALSGSINVDVAIIGGGYTGLACALKLANNGTKVALLEAQHIGFGGSGRNVGLVNPGLWMEPDDINKRLGDDYGNRLYQALSQAPAKVFGLIDEHQISCNATPKGTLQLGRGNSGLAELDRRFNQLCQRQAPVERLDAQQTAGYLGSEHYQGAILDHRAGTIQPLSYAIGLAQAAQTSGCQVFEQSPVCNLVQLPHGWQLSTAHGQVTAAKVVLATNGYSSDLVGDLISTYIPIHFFQFATTPLSATQRQQILPGLQGCWDTGLVMTSIRLDVQGRLILGSIGQIRDGQQSRFLANWAQSMLAKLFPQLGKQTFEYCWSGKIAYSHDNLPHLHELQPGLLTTMGYSGRGIGPGTVMGEAMADHLLGQAIKDLPLPLTSPTSISWRRLKEAYYETGADIYHLGQRLL